jgi:hypothetical protein
VLLGVAIPARTPPATTIVGIVTHAFMQGLRLKLVQGTQYQNRFILQILHFKIDHKIIIKLSQFKSKSKYEPQKQVPMDLLQ